MRFQRLRLVGFKSFVEPTEFLIEPGLTGVVGPNGCGKSNLLEALRWVMGANSAKAMRGEGMDDVIFGGSDRRPARNYAEVRLQIDNADRRAPARFNDTAVIEVVRRIDRGAGSTYRVNGAETRARDVQTLFADASTGANSPALVRQNQISELIAAKPANRRRILEEAAGVAGLHARRHEAGLRLDAAEANLARLGDVAAEVDSALSRLRREARQAEAYRRLSAEIRALQGAAVHARWREADRAASDARDLLQAAEAEVARTAQDVARSAAEALRAAEALKPLREAEMVAAAVLQRLGLERDRLAREAALTHAELARLGGERARNGEDASRAADAAEDARGVLARLEGELQQVSALIAAAPARELDLQAAASAAAARRAAVDGAVERLAAEGAGAAARRQAALDAGAEARALQGAMAAREHEAAVRVTRLKAALEAAEAQTAALAQTPGSGAGLQEAVAAAQLRLDEARRAVAAAEASHRTAVREEAVARDAARVEDDALRRLKSEAQGLMQLAAAGGRGAYPPVLDHVSAPPGLEQAVAAAFGEGLDAALDPRAQAYWAGRDGLEPPAWPDGVELLGAQVQAPPALAARLARIGLAARSAGARLQARLAPGQTLVSREGDLWRWDGFTATASAPRPAAVRLAQKARLAEVEQAVLALQPRAAEAAAAHAADVERLRAGHEALEGMRRAVPPAERELSAARAAYEHEARQAARREAQGQAAADGARRLQAELAEARQAEAAAVADREAADARLAAAESNVPSPQDGAEIADARRAAAAAREAEARARAELEGEARSRDGRLRRREALQRDLAEWRRRAEASTGRVAALAAERARLDATTATAAAAPATLEVAQRELADQLEIAETRRTRASDALVAAETAAAEHDRAARAAEGAAILAREARAAAGAHAEAAAARCDEAVARLREATGLEPRALGERIAAEALAVPPDPAALDAHLQALTRQREAMGSVNLGAETAAADAAARLEALQAERVDLADAIATLRAGIAALNAEGRKRLLAAFAEIAGSFKDLFATLFEGGQAELSLAEGDDPLEAGLEIYACPPGKRLAAMSLMSGGEQALTATALIFAVFLANPAPVCVLDEVDAPLDDANVDRFCRLLDEMRRRTDTRFIAITHNPVTMSRMDRLYGVTMAERGVSQLVSVDLGRAEALVA